MRCVWCVRCVVCEVCIRVCMCVKCVCVNYVCGVFVYVFEGCV